MSSGYWNQKAETCSPDERRALQSERLVKTVSHAYNNQKLYRERMDKSGVLPGDIKSTDDLHKLPFVYKTDLRDTYPYGMFAVPMEQIVRVHATSGTTGKPTVIGYTRGDIETWNECMARSLRMGGVTSSDIIHVSYGYGLFTGGLGAHYGCELLGAAVIPVSTGNTSRQLQILEDFNPTVIMCTPSYACLLAENVQKEKIKHSLRAGFFGAEAWTENMRRFIEEQLGIVALDIFGLAEVCGPGVANECECKNGLHIQEDHFYPEIIDPNTGAVLPEGERGELVFSCITKEALPLLRYRTRDLCSLIKGKCSCGRTTIRMEKPAGRSDDMLIIRGVNVFPSQVESVLMKYNDLAPHYLLVVDRVNNTDTLEIQVEMSDTLFSDEVRKIEKVERGIRGDIESTLGLSVKVKLVTPQTIARSEGKAKRVLDKRVIL
ncbi:MAG: phenylacetate--CoA ligase [Oscillospiraceae bacterium]|nr:phenylacetate--CoA ligase [Oscillospiraceae bacterium]